MDFGKLDLPISPELALVDPELARYARSLLPPVDLDAPARPAPQVVEEDAGAVVALPAANRRRSGRRRVGLILAAALAVGIPAAFVVNTSRGNGTVTARVDGARKTVVTKRVVSENVSPADKPTHRRAAATTVLPATAARRKHHPPAAKTHKTAATHRRTPSRHKTPLLHPTRLLHPAPLLRWPASPTARFFDVVLWRGGKRLLDSWPSTPRLQVPSSWTYGGQRYRLSPGTYLWFVYPGLGSRLQPRFGPLLKSGQFTIASPAAN